MINFACSCGKALVAEERYAGQMVQCPGCGRQVPIPGQPTHFQPPEHRPPGHYSPQAPPQPQPGYQREDDFPPRRPRRRQQASTSSMAVTSLIFGLLGFCVPYLASLLAIIFGSAGMVRTGEGKRSGRGFALTGLILGIFTLLGWGGATLTVIPRIRDAAASTASQNNLKSIGVAWHFHHETYTNFPNHANYGEDGQPLLSWRVHLLPYLEEENLYQQFHLSEPWDSPHNIKLLKKMPRIYSHPFADEENTNGYTHYQVFVTSESEKPNSAFVKAPHFKSRMSSFLDGTSNTILVVEATKPVPWTKPEDLTYSAKQPLPELGFDYSTGEGFNALFADGTVQFINKGKTKTQTIRALITVNGGEIIGGDF